MVDSKVGGGRLVDLIAGKGNFSGNTVTCEMNLWVNQYIEVSRFTVRGSGIAEDKGVMKCFPIEDHEFLLSLAYVMGTGEQSASIVELKFYPAFFQQYNASLVTADQPFRFDSTTEEDFPVCSRATDIVKKLTSNTGARTLSAALKMTQWALSLLSLALECRTQPFVSCQVPACNFIGYNADRSKIEEAIFIINDTISTPLTIKELARKVAINECYLKKGFKTLTGKTIHEYQQERRIEKARVLLTKEGVTVTEVASELGYGSISHFSTAFKRVTGIKPCELLS